MAYPTIRSNSTRNWTATTTIYYPPTVSAGDILLWFGLADTASAQSGWTLLVDGGINTNTIVQYKVATGTEGGTTFSASAFYYGQFMVAIDSGGALPEAVAALTAGDTPNPPSLTPAGGAKDYLWLVWGSAQSSAIFTAPHTQPSGFTALLSVNGVAAAYLNLNAATLDPTAWADSDADTGDFYAATAAIALKPASNSNLFFGSNF